MKITVQVTQEHIDSAMRARGSTFWASTFSWSWSQNCPVALAIRDVLRDTFPPGAIFTVGYTTWKVTVEDKAEQGGFLPQEAQLFIHNIDCRKEVKPFSFQIEVHA